MIMDKYFKPASCREGGTLFQLKNLLNRRNVAKDVSSNYHAVGDFIDLIIDCHIITACMEYCGMENVGRRCKKIPPGLHTCIADNITKKRVLQQLVGEIVDTFFLNSVSLNVDRLENANCH